MLQQNWSVGRKIGSGCGFSIVRELWGGEAMLHSELHQGWQIGDV